MGAPACLCCRVEPPGNPMKIRHLPAALARVLLPAADSNAPAAHADEGLSQPSHTPELGHRLREPGLRMGPAALSDLASKPLDAVISLGGCTASFVSPRGLVVTNHHCAYGIIQYHSAPERDLLAEGFVAATPADELPAAPTSRIYVTQDIRDVTGQVT